MSRQRIRGLLGRLRALETRVEGAAVLSYAATRSKLEELVRELAFEPMTDDRIRAAIDEARDRFEARKQQLRQGPKAMIYSHLMKLAGEPDPRLFATPDEYSRAIGEWLAPGQSEGAPQ